jgi:tetratricopeptide (TPR) repeat protein
MKKITFVFTILFGIATLLPAQTEVKPDPKLLGKCTVDDFKKAPYATWFVKNYDEYQPNAEISANLKRLKFEGIQLKIFLGTWCGDSRREVPRILKTLDLIGFPSRNIEIIAVDNADSVYKQSPGHEEKGLGIYRVPTFIFSEKGTETYRITESPAESMERDLLAIFSKSDYTSNYYSYPTLRKWLANGLLKDVNCNPVGLANQLRAKGISEGELNSAGYVHFFAGELAEATVLFKINAILFPKSANCLAALADAYIKAGKKDLAQKALEQAVKLNDGNPAHMESLVKLLNTK